MEYQRMREEDKKTDKFSCGISTSSIAVSKANKPSSNNTGIMSQIPRLDSYDHSLSKPNKKVTFVLAK